MSAAPDGWSEATMPVPTDHSIVAHEVAARPLRQLLGAQCTSIPDLAPGISTLDAALAYAEVGAYLVPIRRGSKNPGSVLGKGWDTQSSRDPQTIASWFVGTDYGIALHAGRSGLFVIDLDHPDRASPRFLEELHSTTTPIQSTRADDSRLHYVYKMPTDRVRGNGLGSSATVLGSGWGEVRGLGGVFVVGPGVHEKAADGGRYAWLQTGEVQPLPTWIADLLPDAHETPSAPVSPSQVRRFCAAHAASTGPGPLQGVLTQTAARIAARESRHVVFVGNLTWALKEARLGRIDAAQAIEALRVRFFDSQEHPRPGDHARLSRLKIQAEWTGIVSWAVAAASADDLIATKRLADRPRAEAWDPSTATPAQVDQGVAAGAGVGFDQDESPNRGESSSGAGRRALAAGAPPLFDPSRLYGILGDCARSALDGTSEASPVGIFITLACTLSIYLGPGVRCRIAGEEVPLPVWAVMMGASGRSLKGTATNYAMELLRLAVPGIETEIVEYGIGSPEGLVERLEDYHLIPAVKKGGKTVKEAEEVGRKDKRMLGIQTEYAGLITALNKPDSFMGATIRNLWDDKSIGRLNRKKTGNHMTSTHNHVAILGHSTVEEFMAISAAKDFSNGVYNRNLFVHIAAQPMKSGGLNQRREHRDPTLVARLRTAIQAAKQVARTDEWAETDQSAEGGFLPIRSYLRFSDDLDDDWTEVRRHFAQRGGEGALAVLTERAAMHCARLAMLVAVLDADLVGADGLKRFTTDKKVLEEANTGQERPPADPVEPGGENFRPGREFFRFDTGEIFGLPVITREHLQAAREFIDYTVDTAQYLLGKADRAASAAGDRSYERAANYVVHSPVGSVLKSELYKHFSGNLDKAAIDGLVERFRADGRFRVTKERTGRPGQPATSIRFVGGQTLEDDQSSAETPGRE